MGIESNIKNKFLRTLYNDEGWKEFVDALFTNIDFPNVFKYLTVQGIPLYIKFTSAMVTRGYLTLISSGRYQINLYFIDINLSVSGNCTLENGGQSGQSLKYTDKPAGLFLNLNGDTLSDTTLFIESSPSEVALNLNYLLLDDYFKANYLPLLNNGTTSIFWLKKILMDRLTKVELSQMFVDGSLGSRTKFLRNYIELVAVSGSTIIKNDRVLLRTGDFVLSEVVGGVKTSYTLKIETMPARSGTIILTLDGVSFPIFISGVTSIAEIIDLLESVNIPGWTITNNSVNSILLTSDVFGPLTGLFVVQEMIETKELVYLEIGQTALTGGTIHIFLNGVDFPVTITAGQTPEIIANYINTLTFTGWTTYVEGPRVFFLRNTSGTQIAPYVVDYGTNATFTITINSPLLELFPIYLPGEPVSYTKVKLDGIDYIIPMPLASPHTANQDEINFVAAFATFNATNPTGWTASIVSGDIVFVRSLTGSTTTPQFEDIGGYEIIEIDYGPLTLKPSMFTIGLDGVSYPYSVGATETYDALALRMLNDPRILPDWEIVRTDSNGSLGTSEHLILRYKNRTIKTCIDPVTPPNALNNNYFIPFTLEWEPYFEDLEAESNVRLNVNLTLNVVNSSTYSFTIYIPVANTKAQVIQNIKDKLNLNTSFAADWTVLKPTDAGAPVYSGADFFIVRNVTGVSWITNPNPYYGYINISLSYSGHAIPPDIETVFELTMETPNLGGSQTFDTVDVRRIPGGIPIALWSTLSNNIDGQNGCNPILVRIVQGVQGTSPLLELNEEGNVGGRFKYPVLGHQSNFLVLDSSTEDEIDIDGTVFSGDDYQPGIGKYDVEKNNYPTTHKDIEKESTIKVEILPFHVKTKELIESITPARILTDIS